MRVAVLALLTIWGSLQWCWQEHSWSDTRTLAGHLAQSMKRGERVIADSAWTYILFRYPMGVIESPDDVIDANYSPSLDRLDVCQIPWLFGNPDTATRIRNAVGQCGHRRVLSWATRHYYFDTTRLRRGAYTVVIDLYRLPAPLGSSR